MKSIKITLLALLLPIQMMAASYYYEYSYVSGDPNVVKFFQGLYPKPQPEQFDNFWDDYQYVAYNIYLNEEWAEIFTASMSFHGLSSESYSFTIPETVTYNGKAYPVTKVRGMSATYLAEVTVGSNVTELGSSSFARSRSLRKATLPEGLTTIPYGLFSECGNLQSVNIPSTVTSIDYMAFAYTAIKEIKLPEGLKTIGQQAFNSCTGLKSFYIPSSVDSIGSRAFYGCNIDDIYCYSVEVPKLGTGEFYGNAFTWLLQNHTCTLHVPEISLEKYKSAEGWMNFPNIVPIDMTGIEEVSSSTSTYRHHNSTIYDLQGRPLKQKPSKGIYIENGKKVVAQ